MTGFYRGIDVAIISIRMEPCGALLDEGAELDAPRVNKTWRTLSGGLPVDIVWHSAL